MIEDLKYKINEQDIDKEQYIETLKRLKEWEDGRKVLHSYGWQQHIKLYGHRK